MVYTYRLFGRFAKPIFADIQLENAQSSKNKSNSKIKRKQKNCAKTIFAREPMHHE